MVIVVDLATGHVELDAPDDFGRFHVEARGEGGMAALARALERSGAGRVEAPSAVIDVGWVRDRAAGRRGPNWSEGFSGMLAFAAAKGWLRDGGTGIEAHVVWCSPADAPAD